MPTIVKFMHLLTLNTRIMMFMLPLNSSNVHIMLRIPMKYIESYYVDKINPKLAKIIIFHIMDLKCHIDSIRKSFLWDT